VNDVFDNVSPVDIAAATTCFAAALWVLANADERYGEAAC
jgi:hypothetical protein